jgi:hypothetical protein
MDEFMEFTFLVYHKDQGVSYFHTVGYVGTDFREMEELVMDYLTKKDDTVLGVSYIGNLSFSTFFL